MNKDVFCVSRFSWLIPANSARAAPSMHPKIVMNFPISPYSRLKIEKLKQKTTQNNPPNKDQTSKEPKETKERATAQRLTRIGG